MRSLEISKEFSKKFNKDSVSKTIENDLPAYDTGLIDALKNDHQELLELFNKVLESAKNNEFSTLQFGLVEFATSFTTHIKKEDEQLYNYLKILASNKSDLEQKIVSEFASEMKNISISIFSIISQSPHIPVDIDNIDAFIYEFEKIGGLLKDRIEREEKVLYPIYKKNQKVITISD